MREFVEPLDLSKSEVMSRPLDLPFSMNIHEISEDKESRADFVHNVGVLLSQTRESIKGVNYFYKPGYGEYAEVEYKNGYRVGANIHCDSWMAILRDIVKVIEV